MAKNNEREAMLDSKITSRDKSGRMLLGLTVCAAVVLILILGSTVLFGLVGFLISLPLAVLAVGGLIKPDSPISFTVYVPYTWGLVTQNPFNGEPVVYGSGWHWAYPWESASEDDNISLEERVQIEDGLTMDSTSGSMTVSLSFQWRPDLSRLEVFRRMEEESTVERGFFEPLERFVSTLIAKMTGMQAREHQSIISRLALLAFKGDSKAEFEIDEGDEFKDTLAAELKRFRKDVSGLESAFGIIITQVNVSDIDYPEEVRKALGAKDEGAALIQTAMAIAGVENVEEWKELSAYEREQYRAEARVLGEKDTKEHIYTIRGSDKHNLLINADDKE